MRLTWTRYHDGSWACRATYRGTTHVGWSTSRRVATADAVAPWLWPSDAYGLPL